MLCTYDEQLKNKETAKEAITSKHAGKGMPQLRKAQSSLHFCRKTLLHAGSLAPVCRAGVARSSKRIELASTGKIPHAGLSHFSSSV